MTPSQETFDAGVHTRWNAAGGGTAPPDQFAGILLHPLLRPSPYASCACTAPQVSTCPHASPITSAPSHFSHRPPTPQRHDIPDQLRTAVAEVMCSTLEKRDQFREAAFAIKMEMKFEQYCKCGANPRKRNAGRTYHTCAD